MVPWSRIFRRRKRTETTRASPNRQVGEQRSGWVERPAKRSRGGRRAMYRGPGRAVTTFRFSDARTETRQAAIPLVRATTRATTASEGHTVRQRKCLTSRVGPPARGPLARRSPVLTAGHRGCEVRCRPGGVATVDVLESLDRFARAHLPRTGSWLGSVAVKALSARGA